MQQTRSQTIAVWMANGIPSRIVWNGTRYRVNDQPTRVEAVRWWHPAITHPPVQKAGWRFQARSETGETRVFDVVETIEGWELLRSYE